MMKVGDYVTHIGFPPAEGVVVGCQVQNTFPETYKVCVKLSDGRLYWDMLDNWQILKEGEDYSDFRKI